MQVDDDAFPYIFAAGDVIESNGIKNARAAFEQAQVVAENICRSILGKSLIEYKSEWWEGTTKITLGIVSASRPFSSLSLCLRSYMLTLSWTGQERGLYHRSLCRGSVLDEETKS